MNSIYEKIQDATFKVRRDVCGGKDINESVLSHTSGFTKEAVQRVIEEVNVANFVDVLKSGQDRSREFPLADHKVVFKMSALNAIKDTDIVADTDTPGLDFYEKEKVAHVKSLPSLPITPNPKKDISKHSIEFVLAKKDVAEKRAEMYVDSIAQCNEIIAKNVKQIVENIDMRQDRADALVKSAMLRYSDKSIPILNSICKLARVTYKYKTPKSAILDESSPNFKLFKQAMRAIDTKTQIGEKFAELKKKSFFRSKTGGLKRALGYEIFTRLKQDSKCFSPETLARLAGSGLIPAKKAKKPGTPGRAWEKFTKGISEAGTTIGTGMRRLAEPGRLGEKTRGLVRALVQKSPSPEALKKELLKEEEVGDKFSQKFKQKKVIEDLIKHDEILKEQDPIVLANLFDTLVDLAPQVATKKEIVRSFLRQISSQAEPTLDPYYATQLIKLDRVLSGDVSIKMD